MMHLSKVLNRIASPLLDITDSDGCLKTGLLPVSAAGMLAQQIHAAQKKTVLCITEGPESLTALHKDLCLLMDDKEDLVYFPAAHRIQDSRSQRKTETGDPALTGQRMIALSRLARPNSSPLIVTSSVQALMQRIQPPQVFSDHTLRLSLTEPADRDKIIHAILKMNYKPSDEVLEPGQVCVRGCIIDIWPPASSHPLRLEMPGSSIESIRLFDPSDQRSLGRINTTQITPASEQLNSSLQATESVLSYIQGDLSVIWLNNSAVRQHADMFRSNSPDKAHLLSLDRIFSDLESRKGTSQIFTDVDNIGPDSTLIEPSVSLLNIKPSGLHASAFEETRKNASARLTELINRGSSIVISAASKESAVHFFGKAVTEDPRVITHHGPLSSGFGSSDMKVIIVSENDLVPFRGPAAFRYNPFHDTAQTPVVSGFRPAEITDLEPDDLVVHADHGIGIYRGINEITVGGQLQEVITLEYADKMTLHVPVSQAHLLSRYVGLPHHKAKLHRLGGKRWNQERASADKSIMDLAASLLELQAHRAVQPGHAFSRDKPWQLDFEASFGYQETPDQSKAIAEVKRDMEAPHPMDRLICGDAGYGKTEVTMRAAFKAVMDHKQVVLLVPTTVLAQQHYDTFAERMSAFPVKIAMLSRFCSRKEREEVLQGISSAAIDIVIGTHALIQSGVSFKDLGLVIIDEEQRFGVQHKERLKQMRRLVDVLTMTATPIPRTLYLSMTGAREMSLIQTPPGERLAVQTIVAKNTDEVIKTAIQNELNREGQVFYLHNRIITIDRVAARLTSLLPEARIAVAHGRMPAHELSDVMHKFAEGNVDILLCTTIIESGLDIPRANTILIDRADRFGIADLYQLRGRVGRSTRKAYAYLLLPEHGYIDSDARTRISAVKTFSGLAAGFNLALRDMEIRGVGNILGPEQSGHISAIGFGLYCQLLKRTVMKMKGEKLPEAVTCSVRLDFISFTSASNNPSTAVIPYTYVEEEKVRLGLYRKIAEADSRESLSDLESEIKDRFGPIVPEVRRLLTISNLKILCSERNISTLETRDDRLMITANGSYLKTGSSFPRLKQKDADKRLQEILKFVRNIQLPAPSLPARNTR